MDFIIRLSRRPLLQMLMQKSAPAVKNVPEPAPFMQLKWLNPRGIQQMSFSSPELTKTSVLAAEYVLWLALMNTSD